MKNLHPLTIFLRHSMQYFIDRGFDIYEGDEIESEWSNFDALNVPESHPSRDAQDTFWINSSVPKVLRTHTTGSEIEIIKKYKLKPPFKIIVPGRIFRNERTDRTHENTFYQIDGVIIDRKVNFRNLISVLDGWIKHMIGKEAITKIQPSFFPFVEPGLEMYAKLPNTDWMEMLGAGMAHPKVIKNMGLDPDEWQGIMWGAGIDRFAMLKFGINDIRAFNSQDLRILKQFKQK